MKKIVGYGAPFMDFLVGIDHLPTKKDEGARIQITSWQGGGKVATALAAVGQLGGQASMIGIAGKDTYGDFLIQDFKFYGIDTSHVMQDGSNGFSVVLSDQVTKGRNIIARSPRQRPFTEDDIDADFIKQHDILHLENMGPISVKMAEIMHEGGGKVAIDADGYSELTQSNLDKIDIFIGSEFYYNAVFGEGASEDLDRLEENLREFSKHGPEIVVFTLGDKGSAVYCKEGFRYAKGYKVDVVDTVGAGDTYHGAYLYALADGMDPMDAAEFANAVAAIKCTSIGGRSGLPDREMTDSFMKTGKYDRTLIEKKVRRYENFGNS
ncbi:MAG: carbohydrate kinase family protein [Clostridia bacterium]|nr:carbohydrate kinase family protein [Clostridia bacterium]